MRESGCCAKAIEAHSRSLGMILSFSLMTPFMMPTMVLLEAESLPLRFLVYFAMAGTVLGDEPVGAFADEESKLPSRKLYMSWKEIRERVRRRS